MSYLVEADFVQAFGLELTIELTNLEDPGASAIDTTTLEAAFAQASALIDGYLSARYTLPLATVPPLLRRLALDIARYQLGHYGKESDVRQRYDDALRMLQQIAGGTLSLGLPPAQSPTVASGSPQYFAGTRVFTADSLEGF